MEKKDLISQGKLSPDYPDSDEFVDITNYILIKS